MADEMDLGRASSADLREGANVLDQMACTDLSDPALVDAWIRASGFLLREADRRDDRKDRRAAHTARRRRATSTPTEDAIGAASDG